MSSYISAQLRREVIERAGNCCEYCRISQEDRFFSFAIDHIIAEKHRGQSVSENLCLACPDCNAYKGSNIASADPETDELAFLFHPRRHYWDDHFQVDKTTGRIVPLTPEGRVTVFTLRINDADRMQDRKRLVDENRYPCTKIE